MCTTRANISKSSALTFSQIGGYVGLRNEVCGEKKPWYATGSRALLRTFSEYSATNEAPDTTKPYLMFV